MSAGQIGVRGGRGQPGSAEAGARLCWLRDDDRPDPDGPRPVGGRAGPVGDRVFSSRKLAPVRRWRRLGPPTRSDPIRPGPALDPDGGWGLGRFGRPMDTERDADGPAEVIADASERVHPATISRTAGDGQHHRAFVPRPGPIPSGVLRIRNPA